MVQITKDMIIGDILDSFEHKGEEIANEMSNAGLHCVGCGSAAFESLEDGMRAHGIDDNAINALVDRLNEIVSCKRDMNSISMTSRAAAKFESICNDEGVAGAPLRFDVTSGCCGGNEYLLDFSDSFDEKEDAIFESHGIKIYVNKKSLPKLLGSEIDYIDNFSDDGFKVNNPNIHTCQCGSSKSH